MFYISILSCIFLYSSCLASLLDEVETFKSQIAAASKLLDAAATSFITEYKAKSGYLTTTTITYDTTANANDSLNPVKSIRYGFIDNSNDAAYYTSNASGFHTAGLDNHNLYAIELQFKSSDEKPDISVALSGRSVLFIAYGLNNDIIFTDGGSGFTHLSPSSNAEAGSMRDISGFICLLKTQYATAVSGSMPQKTGDSFATIIDNAEGFPGKAIIRDNQQVNLFSSTRDVELYGLFTACSNAAALFNDMASSSASI